MLQVEILRKTFHQMLMQTIMMMVQIAMKINCTCTLSVTDKHSYNAYGLAGNGKYCATSVTSMKLGPIGHWTIIFKIRYRPTLNN